MTLFRPCIDLHDGHVKQIVGGTLGDNAEAPSTNFVSDRPAGWYADLYRNDELTGGHLIMLGPGNEEPALEALRTYPGGLQIGGGMRPENAGRFLDAGASHIIVTSWLFEGPNLNMNRLLNFRDKVGRDRLVIDLSCRRRGHEWFVATDKWKTVTDERIDAPLLEKLAPFCSEFLVHAADVEGRCEGMDWDLVELLGKITPLPATYAGGARSITDLERTASLSQGLLDVTIGSALDLFGGRLVSYRDCVEFNRKQYSANSAPHLPQSD